MRSSGGDGPAALDKAGLTINTDIKDPVPPVNGCPRFAAPMPWQPTSRQAQAPPPACLNMFPLHPIDWDPRRRALLAFLVRAASATPADVHRPVLADLTSVASLLES